MLIRYLKMLQCWHVDAEERPDFTDMITFFRDLCDDQYMVLEQIDYSSLKKLK